ncbi:MAG: Ig-like domain-containing protein [Actinomycetota bacterium]
MGRRTHPPRSSALLAAAVLCASGLGSTSASAGVGVPPIVTKTTSPPSPDGSNGWYKSGTIDVSFVVDLQGGSLISKDPECDITTRVDSDTVGDVVTCAVVTDGGQDSATDTVKRDATAPTLAPTFTPGTLVLNGSGDAAPGADDATSGVDTKGCDPVDTSTAGAHSLQCQATDFAGNSATKTVDYTVEPHGPAAAIAPTRGDAQIAYVTTQFASALVVTVTDAEGNPVPDETVTFHAPFSGASADLSRPSDITNASGVASIRAFANDKVGSYAVRGKLAGVGAARFDLRNAPAPYFSDGFSNGLRKWNRTGDVSIASGSGRPAPSALLRAGDSKTFATHRFNDTYVTACASASVRLNSLGTQAVALLRFRGPGDSGISRVSVASDRELFIRNDRLGGVKLSGQRLPIGEWHAMELCTHVGAHGSISLYLDGTKIVGWRQGLGDRRIAALHLIENDAKTFSLNVDGVLVDARPGVPV